MSSQDKKAYLMKYRAADDEINDLLREKEAIMSRLTRVTTSITGMPHGGSDGDRYCNGVSKLMELEKEIDAKVDALVDFRRELIGHISALDSDRQKRVLKLRYIDGMTWERIALEVGYVPMQVWRIHGEALSALQIM